VLSITNNLNVVPISPSTGTGQYSFKWTIGIPTPGLNFAEVGDGYRIAFSLGGDFGTNVATAITSTSITYGGPRGTGLPEAEGQSSVNYNSATGDDEVDFSKPGKNMAGTCAQITLTLNDGTSHAINIRYVN